MFTEEWTMTERSDWFLIWPFQKEVPKEFVFTEK